jgi:hypothetical protein
MFDQLTLPNGKTVTYHYDDVMDMLFILFEPVEGFTYYDENTGLRGVMIRYDAQDRVVGISAHYIPERLGTENPTDDALRQLVLDLIQQTQPNYIVS